MAPRVDQSKKEIAALYCKQEFAVLSCRKDGMRWARLGMDKPASEKELIVSRKGVFGAAVERLLHI